MYGSHALSTWGQVTHAIHHECMMNNACFACDFEQFILLAHFASMHQDLCCPQVWCCYASACLSSQLTPWLLLQRMWEFLIGLVLLQLNPSSLTVVSAFGLVDGLALLFFGGVVGAYVDRCTLSRTCQFAEQERNKILYIPSGDVLPAAPPSAGQARRHPIANMRKGSTHICVATKVCEYILQKYIIHILHFVVATQLAACHTQAAIYHVP